MFETIRGIDDLHAALADADYVIDAMPLTPQTGHVFDAAAFAAMKPTARFINVGRGKTVVEAALVDALASGGIAGAALDVFEEEPLPADSPLWDMENVIVCPHMSGDVDGLGADFARRLLRQRASLARRCAAAQRRRQTPGVPDGRSDLAVTTDRS